MKIATFASLLGMLVPSAASSQSASMTLDDYPAEALRQHWEGTTAFTLTINTDGTVGNCQITTSSGHDILDKATCSIITRRAHFSPPHDAAGQAIVSKYSSSMNWLIPKSATRVMPVGAPPIPVQTEVQDRDWLSHFPLVTIGSKSYRVFSVRGEGERQTLDSAAAKLSNEGWMVNVFTDSSGKTLLGIILRDRGVSDLNTIMKRITTHEFGAVEASLQTFPNPAGL